MSEAPAESGTCFDCGHHVDDHIDQGDGRGRRCEHFVVNHYVRGGVDDCGCSGPRHDGRDFGVVNGYLVEYVEHCTCNGGQSYVSGAHENGCGMEPVAPISALLAPCPREHVPEPVSPRDEPPF